MKTVSVIDKEKCVGCSACIAVCPAKAIHMEKGFRSTVNPALCIGCGRCVSVCHKGAPSLVTTDDQQA